MNVDPNGTNWWSDFWNGVGEFFKNVGEWFVSVGEWFAETFWQDLIVDKVFNSFIIDTLWEKGLKPAGLFVWDFWGKAAENKYVDDINSILGIGLTIAGLVINTPIITIANVIVTVFDFLLWFRGLFKKENK